MLTLLELRMGRPLLGLVMTLPLAGCAIQTEWGRLHEQGFRLATVHRIAAADQLPASASPDCRKGMTAQALADRPFVMYQYRGAGAFPWRYAIHPVPDSVTLREGERVVVNVTDCTSVPQHR